MDLFNFLQEEATEKHKDLGLDIKKMPDKQWMLYSLATLNPEHQIFSKSYRPVLKHQNVEVGNSDGYFDGLPQRLAHELRGNAVATYTKEERVLI